MPVMAALAWMSGVIVAGAGSGAESPAAATDGTVLDWASSSWRHFLTFRPPQFTGGGYLPYHRGWDHGVMQGRVFSADPSADWMKPEFDDASWLREARPEYGTTPYDPVVRVQRLRGRFQVADPARVSGLKLDIEYAGGVAVWLNGQEIAPQDLPAGPLTADVLAEPYPVAAYEWGSPRAKGTGYRLDHLAWDPPVNPEAARWRLLSMRPDPSLLRRGENILAVAIHQSAFDPFARRWIHSPQNGGSVKITGPAAEDALKAGRGEWGGDATSGVSVWFMCWPHGAVKSLRLAATPTGAVQRPARPAGLQQWTADIHHRFGNHDFNDPGEAALVARIVAAKNGAHSAVVVVGAAEGVTGLGAKMGDLVQVGGGKMPAEAVSVRYAAGIVPDPKKPDGQIMDRLAERPPASIPANSCQPIWITVKVPKDGAPGEYRGTLTISHQPSDRSDRSDLSANPRRPTPDALDVQVRVFVMDWALPDSKEYAGFVGLEHAFWGAPAQYKVQPWSEEHWKHLERVVKLMGEVGSDLASLPVTCDGNEGNDESLVPWVKKGDPSTGSGQSVYDYDWRNLDRYLDLVAKDWGTKVTVLGEICSAGYGSHSTKWKPVEAIRYGPEQRPTVVTMLDPGTGKKEALVLPAPSTEEWKKQFVPFAKALRERLEAKGFERLCWGWCHDWVSGVELKAMVAALAAELPEVGWARCGHQPGGRLFGIKTENYMDVHLRGFPESYARTGEPTSQRGWGRPGNIHFPRMSSNIQSIGAMDHQPVGTFVVPMALHWLPENGLVSGACGFARLGADFWPSRRVPYNYFGPGLTEPCLLLPGPDGAESTQRFEALREGVQEAEVRIWLERNSKDAQEPAKTVLADRIRTMMALPQGFTSNVCAYYPGWQERSWDLYAAAAVAAGSKAPTAEDKARFFGPAK